MAFPADPLPLVVEIAPGADLTADPSTWPWVDVTDRARVKDRIRIDVGRGDWGEAVDPSTCTLTFNNRSGDFSEYNPLGQWYGLLGRDTPLRVSIDRPGGRVVVFGGFVPAWVPRMDKSGADRVVSVTAYGVLYRLQPASGRPAERSAMRRTIAASSPVAYWPCEDGLLANQAASALPGHPPLTVTGTGEFGPVEDVISDGVRYRYGTSALMDLSGGAQLHATLPSSVTDATATGWSVAIGAAADVRAAGDITLVLADVHTPGGTYVRWRWQIAPVTGTELIAYDADGAATTVISNSWWIPFWMLHNLSVWQDGAVIQAGINWDEKLDWGFSGSVPGTLGGIVAIDVNPTGATSIVPMQVGHLTVWVGHPFPLAPIYVDEYGVGIRPYRLAYRNEAAHLRLARLCAEDGVPIAIPAVPEAGVTRVGDQPVATSLDLYRECETADQGLLYEEPFGLVYTPRSSLYNQAPTLVLDWSDLGDPPQPDGTGQRYRNRVRVSRSDGSSAVAELPDAAAIAYEESVEVNLSDDGPLPQHAAWRLHLAGQRGLRWPTLTLDLAARPDLIDAWLACQVGSRIQVGGVPADVAADGIDLLLEGWTLTLGPYEMRVDATCSPARPWLVGEVDGDQRVATDGSTLAAPLDTTATTMQITADHPWTTDPNDFPLDVAVGGERITLSSISGATSPQTATIAARAVNGVSKSHPAGTRVDVWDPGIVAL